MSDFLAVAKIAVLRKMEEGHFPVLLGSMEVPPMCADRAELKARMVCLSRLGFFELAHVSLRLSRRLGPDALSESAVWLGKRAFHCVTFSKRRAEDASIV